jgi:hypothetical protein
MVTVAVLLVVISYVTVETDEPVLAHRPARPPTSPSRYVGTGTGAGIPTSCSAYGGTDAPVEVAGVVPVVGVLLDKSERSDCTYELNVAASPLGSRCGTGAYEASTPSPAPVRTRRDDGVRRPPSAADATLP